MERRVDGPAPLFWRRRIPDGASLAISAPDDSLYAACEVNEVAWERAVASLSGGVDVAGGGPDDALERLLGLLAEERNPPLLELRIAAGHHRRRGHRAA